MTSPSRSQAEVAAASEAARAGAASAETGLAGAGPEAARTGFDAGPAWARWLPPAVALAASLWGITTPSFWRDEAATIAAVRRPFGDLIVMLGNVDAVHAAYYILMWPIVHLFGAGEFAVRLPSALAATVTAAMIAAIGRRMISPRAGLAAGLLYAILPVSSRYGQEARSYAMVVMLAVVASYLLVRVLAAEPQGRRRWLIGYGASLAVLGILNIFGLLLIAAHAVTVALRLRGQSGDPAARRLGAGWLAAVVAGVVIASPLLVLGWQQRGQIAWLSVNRSSSGLGTLFTLSGSYLVTAAMGAVLVVALVLGLEAGKEQRTRVWPWKLAELSLPWLVVPPALLLGTSLITPVYTSRYVLMCIPALTLIVGAAIVGLGRIAGPIALGIVLLAGSTTQLTQRSVSGHYDNIRAVDQIVAALARPGDVVLYTNPNAESFGAGYSYGLGTLPNVALKQGAIPSGTLAGTNVPVAEIRARLRYAKRVWVVEINRFVGDPQILGLDGRVQGPALLGVPMAFVRTWHERGDYLILYRHS